MTNLFFATLLGFSGCVSLVVAGYAWKHRSAAGATPLAIMMLAEVVWSWMYAAFWLVSTQQEKFFWISLAYIGVVILSPAFLLMALEISGRENWLTRGLVIALISLGLFQLILLWSDPWSGVFFGGVDIADPATLMNGGPGFWFGALYGYFISFLAFTVLAESYLRASHVRREQFGIMLVSASLPFIAFLMTFLRLSPFDGLDTSPVVIGFCGVMYAYGLFSYSTIDLAPMGRDAVIEKMEDCVLVIDRQERIIDLNSQAKKFADAGKSELHGRPVREVFGNWIENCGIDLIREDARFQVKEKSNQERYFDITIMPLTHKNGEPAGRLILWRDISAQKTVEEGFQKFFFAVEQSNASIIITDPDGHIEYVNPFFTRLTGYDIETVRGHTPSILKSGQTPEEVYKSLWAAITNGREWGGEMLNKKRNGDLFWEYNRISPVTDSQGKVTHYLAIKEDITQRKTTEAELREVNLRLQAQLSEIEQLHAQLHEESIHDSLTGLFNRKFMEETLERELANATRNGKPLSVVMIDIDRFKTVNDTFGHSAGDSVLKTLGTFLRENTRSGDLACRYGGDEMAVVMPNATLDSAYQRADEWRIAFQGMKFNFGNTVFSTTLSQGVASFPEHATSSFALLNASDKALYTAKEQRNAVCSYDPNSMHQSGQL